MRPGLGLQGCVFHEHLRLPHGWLSSRLPAGLAPCVVRGGLGPCAPSSRNSWSGLVIQQQGDFRLEDGTVLIPQPEPHCRPRSRAPPGWEDGDSGPRGGAAQGPGCLAGMPVTVTQGSCS